ncbi:MAG: tRNA (adenosine(37)-N6)-threonylcarbamoyltransferase complex dimerization subunit type 1 TsaB [Coprobacillus sp.]|nr:tRNA (adenosine(37)-N6)-threonylcarbamoyltransferase complex dimerization subunit type 1 TsaB [Coprobacillus sp.]
MKQYTIILDSSFSDLAVGVALDDKVIKQTIYPAWQKQSELMVPELAAILDDLKISRDDIKDIIVSIGPASYTGVRIALTIAKVIALSTGCSIYPVDSLNALKNRKNPSICVINARSGYSYFGVFHNAETIVPSCIIPNDEVIKYIKEHPQYTLCGETEYLGFSGFKGNIIEEMLSLKPFLKEVKDTFTLAPVYLKRSEL